MSSIYRVFRQAIVPHVYSKSIFARGVSTSCGSGRVSKDQQGKEGKPGKDSCNKILCPICQYACDCSPMFPSMYDRRKFGHNLPGNTRTQPFEVVPNIPADIFRCTTGEAIGPQGQASKCGCYLNPEYFSYQHMTYYDMHLILRSYRNRSPKINRKPI